MNYRAIFIDIDNTLLDFDAYVRQTLEEGLKHFGLRPYEDWMYEAFHEENNKLWRQIEDGSLTFEELQQVRFLRVFERFGIDFDGPVFEKYFRAQLRECAIPVEGAYLLLNTLIGHAEWGDVCMEEQRVKAAKEQESDGPVDAIPRPLLCAATNGPFEQQCHRIELAGMKAYFDYIFVSEDLGVSKPDQLFFEKALEKMEKVDIIHPSDCAIIGDSMTSDMEGGFRMGMHTIFFSRNGRRPESKRQPDELYFSLKEVSEGLKQT